MGAEIAPLTGIDQVLLRLTYLKVMAAAVAEADKDARTAAAKLLRKGDTLACWSPLDPDALMSRVSMSKPKPVAKVTDAAALDQWIRENYPDKVRTEESIVGTDAEVIAVLREHAPHLLAKTSTVPGWAVNELLTRSTGAGEPAGFGGELGEHAPPGIEVSNPHGVLSVTVDPKTGPAAIRELWDARWFGMDGTVIALPGGESHDTEG
jgi:hypothetical protein